MPESNLYLPIIAALAFALRLWPRLRYPRAYNYDTYFHLALARMLRENGLRPLKTTPVNRVYHSRYPCGFHYLLAIAPKRAVAFIEQIISPLLDTALVVLIFFGCHVLWTAFSACPPALLPETVSLLFALSPALLRIGSGPRTYSGNPRILGQLLQVAHLILAIHAAQTSSFTAAIAAVILFALLPLVAKFAVQAAVAFAVPMLFILGWPYLLILVTGFALIFAWPTTRALFLEHLQFTHNYFTRTRHGFIGFAPRSFKDWLASVRQHALPKLRSGNVTGFCFWCLDEQYFPHYLLVCLTPLLCLPFGDFSRAMPPGLTTLLLAWVGAAIFMALATKARWLMPLGEGERYLEYAFAPILMLAVSGLWGTLGLWALTILTITLGLICIARVLKRVPPLAKQYSDFKEAFAFLGDQPDGKILPVGYVAYPGLYFENKSLLGFLLDPEHNLLTEDEHWMLRRTYPLPDPDIHALAAHFKPRYLMAQQWAWKRYASLVAEAGVELGSVKPIFQNQEVVIFCFDHFSLNKDQN